MTAGAELPFRLETDLERAIARDPAWRAGFHYGNPRPGHPEGSVAQHVADVLQNIDRFYGDDGRREPLRLVAVVHDSFKYRVDESRPRSGENHHAMRARRFAEQYLDDPAVLDVIEVHDEAYNAWQKGHRDHDWPRAEQRARTLLDRLGDSLGLYIAFFRCDNSTGDKSPVPLRWFQAFADR